MPTLVIHFETPEDKRAFERALEAARDALEIRDCADSKAYNAVCSTLCELRVPGTGWHW
jgi:hypothetical protein